MPPKGSFWSDTFEQALEFGQSTAKQTGQSVKQTFSPLKILEQVVRTNQSSSQDKGKEKLEAGQVNKPDHTPLDFDKLQQKYSAQDKQKTEALRYRLFQLVKSGEEKAITEKKKEEGEEKRKLLYEEQEKKRKEEKKKQEQAGQIPQGKIRRSIFSPKKMAQRQQMEVKPSAGKQ